MKNTIYLFATISLMGCATGTKWNWEKKPSKIKYKYGTIQITPKESFLYQENSELLTVHVKITNDSKKIIEFKSSDIYATTPSGQTITIMSDKQIALRAKKRGAMASGLMWGMGANSAFAEAGAEEALIEDALKSGKILPGGHVQGDISYLIPKTNAEELTFKFYESLRSTAAVKIYKDMESVKEAEQISSLNDDDDF